MLIAAQAYNKKKFARLKLILDLSTCGYCYRNNCFKMVKYLEDKKNTKYK